MKIYHLSLLKAFKGSLALIILALFIQGCGGSGGAGAQPLSPVSSEDTILAFGDSLTEGYGVASDDSYPTVLASLSDRTVVNAGITGETTAEGLARFTNVINDTNPYLMILMEGGNDFLSLTTSRAVTKANLSAMIDVAKGKDVQVVLLGVPDFIFNTTSASLYQELADEHELVYDGDLIPTLLLTPEYRANDFVHFTKEGYQKLAEGIHDLLIDNGAL